MTRTSGANTQFLAHIRNRSTEDEGEERIMKDASARVRLVRRAIGSIGRERGRRNERRKAIIRSNDEFSLSPASLSPCPRLSHCPLAPCPSTFVPLGHCHGYLQSKASSDASSRSIALFARFY